MHSRSQETQQNGKNPIQVIRHLEFKGTFFIEPKPMEPSKHQYDFDSATVIGFLREFDLLGDFKLNIETNHATLAGHTVDQLLREDASEKGSPIGSGC